MEENYYWMFSFPLRKGLFDDDYYFFEDGRILHYYDESQIKYNIENFVNAEDIPEDKRRTMLQACPEDKIKIIAKILQL